MKNEYRGGFSKEVYASKNFQDYINGPMVAGYIGDENRTGARDSFLETRLRLEGLGPNGTALWLTSTKARHLMDDVDETTTMVEFEERVREYTKHAFLEVTIWSHPDHEGSLKSTMDIRERLFDAVNTLTNFFKRK